MTEVSAAAFQRLMDRVDTLEAESEIRRIQTRYMFLCDTPMPEYGIESDEQRINQIMALYTEDAVWEGSVSITTVSLDV